MSRFDRETHEEQAPARGEVSRPTGFCSVSGCHEKATLRLAMVDTPQGKRVRAIGSDVINVRTRTDGSTSWTIRDGFRFVGWFERCSLCGSLEQQKIDHITFAHAHPDEYDACKSVAHMEPFASIRGHKDFCEFFGVKSVGEALSEMSK